MINTKLIHVSIGHCIGIILFLTTNLMGLINPIESPDDPFLYPVLAPTDKENTKVDSARYGFTRIDTNTNVLFHYGVDLKADIGTDLHAIYSGCVIYTRTNISNTTNTPGSYGNYIIIESTNVGIALKYCHLSEVCVAEKQIISHGMIIGKTGRSGNAFNVPNPHLHLEASTDCFKSTSNIINPEPYLRCDLVDPISGLIVASSNRVKCVTSMFNIIGPQYGVHETQYTHNTLFVNVPATNELRALYSGYVVNAQSSMNNNIIPLIICSTNERVIVAYYGLSDIYVKSNCTVKAGEVIGKGGYGGFDMLSPYVYIEIMVRHCDSKYYYVDPCSYIRIKPLISPCNMHLHPAAFHWISTY